MGYGYGSESASTSGSGSGCGLLFAVAFGLMVLLVLAPPSNRNQNPRATADNDTEQHFSGNEFLSRNTAVGLNLGEINNFFYDCVGNGACTFVEDNSVSNETNDTRTTTTETTTTNAPVSVEGQRNVVTGGVIHMCKNAEGSGYQTTQPCREGYTEQRP